MSTVKWEFPAKDPNETFKSETDTPDDLWLKNDFDEWLKKYLGKERKIFFVSR